MGLSSEVVDQELDDDWHSDISGFIVFQLVNLLCDKSREGHLKLFLVSFLSFTHVLSLHVNPIAHQRRSSLHQFWKLSADFFGDKSDEILDLNIDVLEEFSAIFHSEVPAAEDPVDGAEPQVVESFDVEVGFYQYEPIETLHDP